jgi:Rrf2 family protein
VLSQTAEYALRAVLYLAEHQGERPIPVDAIAEDLSIPRNYLSKILHTLAKRDLLSSSRGRGGGFGLPVPASALPLLAVVEPFDELEGRQQCLLGRTRCSEASPCAAHHRWKEMVDRVTVFFRETTVKDLIQASRPNGLAARHANLAVRSS